MSEATREALKVALDRAQMLLRQEVAYVSEYSEKLKGHERARDDQQKVVDELTALMEVRP